MTSLRTWKLWATAVLVALGLCQKDPFAGAQEAVTVAAKTESTDMQRLEHRVQELEDMLRRMQTNGQPGPAPAANNGTPATLPSASPPRASLGGPTDALPVPGGTSVTMAQDQGLPPGTVDPAQVPSGPSFQPQPTEGERAPTALGASTGGWGGAGWREGFFIESADKNFILRFTGQIQGDYRFYGHENDYTDTDTFLMRRVRLGVEADMYKYFEFRLLPDFGQGKFVLQDAYMNVHYVNWFQPIFGKFKEPVSYEQLIQDRFVPTIERSIIDQEVPARDEGVMVHGEDLFGKRLDYAVGVFNGEINGDADTNDHKDIAARVVVRPFAGEDTPIWLRYLQVGVSGTTGKEQEPINPQVLKTPLQVPWFTFNTGVRANGLRNRIDPEISYFVGGFGIYAQYYDQSQEISPAPVGGKAFKNVDVSFDGWHVTATWLLTGEQRTAYTILRPLRPFNPCSPLSCPGAFELVARVSRLDLSGNVFLGGPARLADPTKSTAGATELTVGFNWYLNAWVRFQFNWEHDFFDSAIPLLTRPFPFNYVKENDAFAARFQIIF
jgi:phosphate-selective porin OprO and OprP